MSKNVTQGWKTTAIGVIILAAAIASIFFVENVGWTDAAIGIAIGLGLVFSPDDILSRIKEFLSKKTTNETSP